MRPVVFALIVAAAILGSDAFRRPSLQVRKPLFQMPTLKIQKDDPALRGAIEDAIMEAVEKIRDQMPEPIKLENLSVDLGSLGLDSVSGSVSVTELSLSGIKSFEITALKFNLLSQKLDFTLLIKTITLSTGYTADVTVDGEPVVGDGTVNGAATDLTFTGTAKVNILGLTIVDLVVKPHVESVEATITGLNNDPELSQKVSDAITENGARVVNENADLISSIIGPMLKDLINNILHPNSL